MEPYHKTNQIEDKCILCFQKIYNRLFDKYSITLQQKQYFNSLFKEAFIKYKNLSAPEIQRELNQKFCDIVGVADPFEDEKRENNQKALELYKIWKPKIIKSQNGLDLALRLSIAGNIMDYGANSVFDIEQTINNVLNASFAIDNSKLLFEKIDKAKNILYLGDNAGEIVFDKLFIETMSKDNVVYAVKKEPILNDATIEDAQFVEMNKIAKVITNGYNAPSTILSKCSKTFIEYYNNSDLIISKGQGNLEGLINENNKKIFFLLMIKCDVIGNLLNVKKGDFVVYNKIL